jgi:hypothetical protein
MRIKIIHAYGGDMASLDPSRGQEERVLKEWGHLLRLVTYSPIDGSSK